jgi:hypothetical protein
MHSDVLRAAKSQSPAMTHQAVRTEWLSRRHVNAAHAEFSAKSPPSLETYEKPTKAAFKIPWVRPEHALETPHRWNPEGFE